MTSTGSFRGVLVTLAALFVLPWAFAQQPGSGGGGTGSGGGGATGGSKGGDATKVPPTAPTPTRPQPGSQERQPPRPQMIFVSGAVVMEDGSQVPPDAVIERFCQGRVSREAHVSPNGGFSFQIGGNSISSVMPDASEEFHDFARPGGANSGLNPTGFGSSSFSSLVGCEIRAALPGYRSTRVILDGSNNLVGQIDVGTILLVPISKVSGTVVSATNLNAPKPARKALDKAQKAFQKKKYDEAEKNLKEAIQLYPNFAAAYTGLGELYQATSRMPEAREAYQKAISLDDKYVAPYVKLARLAGMERNWRETADLTDKALLLDPIDYPEGYYFNAIAHYNLNDFEAAERSARKVQMLDPQHRMVQAFMILANILEQKQDFNGAVQQLQKYVSAAPQAPNLAEVRTKIEKLQQLSKPVAEKKTP